MTNKEVKKRNNKKRLLKTDVPLGILVILALLTLPRVVVHDLRLLPLDSLAYTLLTVVPWIIWLLVAVFRRNKKPLYDFIVLGLLFGLFLAITHQLTWNASWGDDVPRLGGNLKDVLSPGTEVILMRIAMFISSIVTGIFCGVFAAVIAWVVAKVRPR